MFLSGKRKTICGLSVAALTKIRLVLLWLLHCDKLQAEEIK
jgi:hypothetical protein